MPPLPPPQAGILNRPPEHLLAAALTIAASDATAALEQLRELLAAELRSDIADFNGASDPASTTLDTGELGPSDGFNRSHLTVTLGISDAGFNKLGVSPDQMPQDLISTPWAEFSDTPVVADAGDLVLQICADDVYVVEHVLRRVEHELAGVFSVTWSLIGSQRFTSRNGRVAGHEARAINGFHDGVSNLDPRHNVDDASLVFVDPAQVGTYPQSPPPGQQNGGVYGQPTGPIFPPLRQPPNREPDWTAGGSYLFVRGSRFDTGSWDTNAIGVQQHAVGRYKFSGAPLDATDDPAHLHDEPNLSADPNGAVTPLDAHVRKANPRDGQVDAQRRIFRRGYPLIASTLQPGGLTRGLVFIAYGRTLSSQVEFILKAWIRNNDFPTPGAKPDAMLAFEAGVIAGGYYFVPALEHANRPTSWVLPST